MPTRPAATLLATVLAISAVAAPPAAEPLRNAAGPYEPAEAPKHISVLPGLELSQVACEPAVVDAVAMCFDDRGRIYVCEMPGYPNGGRATGEQTGGRIKLLEDKDGDGRFETVTTFVSGLRFPTGVTPYKGGVLVANAPELLYIKDTNGDGIADEKTVLYTGFELGNIQQLPNALQWGPDNRIHGMVAGSGGTITCPQKPDMPPVTLRGRGFRFDPAVPGSFEPTSGGGQYGLCFDAFGHAFTATNSQHLRQIVLRDEDLRRNPDLPPGPVTADIPDDGPATKVFRSSPFEAWRVERTTRRAKGEDSRKFPATELVPGGFTSSSCGPIIYEADLLPPEYRGNYLVCEPGNNLIHRKRLEPNGPLFVGKRADKDREFLAANDNWFRPVWLTLGPDGAVYVCDFYREVIETPLSLPDDIKARLNLETRGRGRIWRIAPAGFKPGKLPDFTAMTDAELAAKLASSNLAVRTTARRLLIERNAVGAADAVAGLLPAAKGQRHLPDLLRTLAGLGRLTPQAVDAALTDPLPGNREVGLQHVGAVLKADARLGKFLPTLAADKSPMVRRELAFAAATLPAAVRGDLLAKLVAGADPWLQTAVFASAQGLEADLIDRLTATSGGNNPVLGRAAVIVGARGDDAEIARVLARAADHPALLTGLGQGMRTRSKTLADVLSNPPAELASAVAKLTGRFQSAAATLTHDDAKPAARLAAARLLGFAPFTVAEKALLAGLSTQASGDLQREAVLSLAAHSNPQVADLLLDKWDGLTPNVRREVQEVLLARPDRTAALLAAVEAGKVKPAELDPARVAQLKQHPRADLRAKANRVLAAVGSADRKAVIADYQSALTLSGDAAKGKVVFKAQCASCHKLGGEGHEVGPNLLAVVPGKSGADLLTNVLDPNREVDSRYLNFQAVTLDGRTVTGVVVAESAGGITLRRADGAEDTVRRADLESLKSTGQSLMPEGLEKQVDKQQMADLFAYLRSAVK
ncbi:MAG: PVC-type heme-binding CxxCH protein [Gemmataceae bacterium]